MKVLIWGISFGLVFEVVTLIFRFYFGLESNRDTAIIGNFTGGIRIHHGYIGILLIVTSFLSLSRKIHLSLTDSSFTPAHWLFALGMGLLISDLLHHFVVLWALTGDPQWNLVYPGF